MTVGVDELTQKQQRDMVIVARIIAQAGRFSVFEATANQVIARTMDKLMSSGWFDVDTSSPFPWTKVTLTDKGKEAIKLPECFP